MNVPALQLLHINKSFGATRALSNATLELHAASVSALVGENGAGKSTLVKILSGIHRPDDGEIRLDGRIVRIDSPRAAQSLGISVIHQESAVFDDLSIAENIFIAAPPLRFRMIYWRAMRQRASEILTQLESPLHPDTPVRELSVAQKHLVQIARALSHNARIVVMDEPTAALSKNEADDLLKIVSRLRGEGRAVLFISHKFEEVFAIADRYTVFRDGSSVAQGAMSETSVDELIRLMVGRQIDQATPKSPVAIGAEVMRVTHLTREPEFSDVTFEVGRGEILGVYGLIGAGRSNVMRTVFGIERADRGDVAVNDQAIRIKHPDDAIRAGIAYVPEDRQGQGAIMSQSIAANVVLPGLEEVSRYGFLRRDARAATAEQWSARLGIKCASVTQLVQDLSGGNQQKTVLAKWLQTRPQILILDEPTKGIDIGAKTAVHRIIGDLAAQGIAIVLVSSELPEILTLSDRVLVMRRGRVSGAFSREDATAEKILRAAAA